MKNEKTIDSLDLIEDVNMEIREARASLISLTSSNNFETLTPDTLSAVLCGVIRGLDRALISSNDQ